MISYSKFVSHPKFCCIYTNIFISNLSDQDVIHLHITLQEKSDLMEEVLTEVSVYLGMLYHLIEAFKGHDDFADELSMSFIQYLQQSLT